MVKVTLEQGVLVGGKSISENGTEYFEFLNIPYAKPPVGPLRFKSPQHADSWAGTRDATKSDENKICAQNDLLSNSKRGTEDCLYLNVYTPRLPAPSHKNLPVMVYIHGGGFVLGNGTIKDEAGPDFLVEQEVVVVSINYRLNIFGFLCLDIPEAAGNMGLKDQVMALKWVQKNIHVFCGDKDQITLFGISAGSASIEYQILSPMSKGLFHKAILQSGSTLNPWAITYKSEHMALKIVNALGYSENLNDIYSIYKILMTESTENICEAVNRVVNASGIKNLDFGFVPTIEKSLENIEAFLTETPYNILKQGQFNKVEILRGFCEFESYIYSLLKQRELTELTEKKIFAEFFPRDRETHELKAFDKVFNKIYFEEYKNSDDKELFATHFLSDLEFSAGVYISTKLMEQHSVPTYFYVFVYDGKLNIVKKMLNVTKNGACHGDDTLYIFKMKKPLELVGEEPDKMMRNKMVKMWTNFAKTGDPTPNTDSLLPIKWPMFKSDQQKYLVIDNELTVKEKYEPKRMVLFEELYEKRLL